MKTWIKTSLLAALAATTLASGAAMAQCDGHGWGHRHDWHNATPEQMKERMQQRTELYLARLELVLALTPEQKQAWADFKKATEARSEAMLKRMESKRNAEQPKTVIERLARAEERSKERANILADMRKATEAFYAKLSAPQKTVFDGESAYFGDGHGKGKWGHWPDCMAGEQGICPGAAKGDGRGKR